MIKNILFLTSLCISVVASASIYAPQYIRCEGEILSSCRANIAIDSNFKLVQEGKIVPGLYPFNAGTSMYYVEKSRRNLTQFSYYGPSQGSAVLFFESNTNNIEADSSIPNEWNITGKYALANGGSTNHYPLKVVFNR